MSEFREVKGNLIMMGKHMRLRIHQASYNHWTVRHSNDDIALLDYESDERTLCSIIIKIKSTNKKKTGNLFCVNSQD